MSVGGVPPRAGLPLTLQEQAPATAEKAKEKPAPIKDSVERAATQKATPRTTSALPTNDHDNASHLQAFTALAAQVGEQPEGVRMASMLEATLPQFETHTTLASLAFSPKQIAASIELMQRLRAGSVTLSAEQSEAVKERFATLTATVTAPPLDPALAGLVAGFSKVFAKLEPKARVSRKRVDKINPDEARELFEQAFEPEEESDTFEFKKEADALNIILPDLSVIALEQTWKQEWPKLEGHDPEQLAELIMCHVAAANEGALAQLLDDMAKDPNDAGPSEQLTFYLERRAGFATMVRAMLTRGNVAGGPAKRSPQGSPGAE